MAEQRCAGSLGWRVTPVTVSVPSCHCGSRPRGGRARMAFNLKRLDRSRSQMKRGIGMGNQDSLRPMFPLASSQPMDPRRK
ncbi:hypothetical protein AM571_PC01577 (plasmid) [Rhizobium etli 8C-3]|uniref:Uncharacterized protein n=1 Tax=Rhizobium etli 8C-3 TaxID=538025 RepID=A0A1L5PGG4_RHIET|nr:hypothetical protein AM571_PC01577 [Rhizobium etli 8C-3]